MAIAIHERTTLRASEVAELLGVSVRTVYNWSRRADFPAFRKEGVILICRAELEEWARAQAEQNMKSRSAGITGYERDR